MLNIISLGAGVQSSTMALMAAHGELEMPDCAIFADTQAEPKAVYTHLEWLISVLPFSVHVVTAGSILEDTLNHKSKVAGRAATAPFFTAGKDSLAAPLRRQCTSHYKIEPVNRQIKSMLGFKKGQRMPREPVARVWMGISTDEIIRMKPAREAWLERHWPLIDKRMNRNDCQKWLERHGYSAPRSACTFCPYHSNEEWRRLRDESPEDFAQAVKVDEAIAPGFIRNQKGASTGKLFLHRSLKRLKDVDFSTLEDHGQLNMFGNECEGMCGV